MAKETHACCPPHGLDHHRGSGAAQGHSRGPPFAPLPGLTWTMGPGRARRRTSPPAVRGDSLAWIRSLIKTLMTPRPQEVLTAKERFPQPRQQGNDPETAASAPGPSAALLEALMTGQVVGSGAIKPAGRSSPPPSGPAAFEAASKQVRPWALHPPGSGAAPLGLRVSGPRSTERQGDVRSLGAPGAGALAEGPGLGALVEGAGLGALAEGLGWGTALTEGRGHPSPGSAPAVARSSQPRHGPVDTPGAPAGPAGALGPRPGPRLRQPASVWLPPGGGAVPGVRRARLLLHAQGPPGGGGPPG